MKDRDNHNQRTGASLVLQARDASLGYDAMIRNLRILARTAENFGVILDYNEGTVTATGVDACLVVEYERARARGRRDASYQCFRDQTQAGSFLESKLDLLASVADAMGVDLVQWGTYHETL